MPKDSSHRFCIPPGYPPGTFRFTDARDRLNFNRANFPSRPPFDGHGGGHKQRGAPYQNFGAKPKTFPNGRSYHTGSQSYHQQQSRQSKTSGPRNQPRAPHSLAQYNISHRTVIVNHSSTDPDTSSLPSSISAAKEPSQGADESSPISTAQYLDSLHEEPRFKEASTMTDIYFSKHRSDLEVTAVLQFLGTSRNDASTQTGFHEISSALLDCFTDVNAPYSDEFNPLTPTSDPSTPSCSADVFSLDSSFLPDATFFPMHRKESYDFDMETLLRTAPNLETSEPVPNLLIEETKTMFNSLSLSGVPTDLLSFSDQTPILPSNTYTFHNQSPNLPSKLAMDTTHHDEFNLIPEFSAHFVPGVPLSDDANLDESL